jgi:hypothetical protein
MTLAVHPVSILSDHSAIPSDPNAIRLMRRYSILFVVPVAIKRPLCLAMRAALKKGKVVLFSPPGICLDIHLKVMKPNHSLVPL